jgi:hypothetical protein
MHIIQRLLTIVAGALLFAIFLFALLAAPGFLSDRDSTVPNFPLYCSGAGAMSWNDPNRYDTDIARALATPGGHLSIGRRGFTLHFEHSTLSGYGSD